MERYNEQRQPRPAVCRQGPDQCSQWVVHPGTEWVAVARHPTKGCKGGDDRSAYWLRATGRPARQRSQAASQSSQRATTGTQVVPLRYRCTIVQLYSCRILGSYSNCTRVRIPPFHYWLATARAPPPFGTSSGWLAGSRSTRLSARVPHSSYDWAVPTLALYAYYVLDLASTAQPV